VSGQARGANVTLFGTEPLYRTLPEGLYEQVANALWWKGLARHHRVRQGRVTTARPLPHLGSRPRSCPAVLPPRCAASAVRPLDRPGEGDP
jgi:hypothetical protein